MIVILKLVLKSGVREDVQLDTQEDNEDILGGGREFLEKMNKLKWLCWPTPDGNLFWVRCDDISLARLVIP